MESLRNHIERHGLDELLSADLLEALRPRRLAPGELLIRAGDSARELFFFVEGSIKVYSSLENGQSLLAAFYEPFDVLGEVELFNFERYTLSVEAMADTLCLSLPAEAVRRAAPRNCGLLVYLCGRMGAKLANRVIAESINLRYPVENRLASYLLAATDAEGLIIGREDLGELADFIGASYRQLARVLRAFRDEGILEDSRGRVRVRDRRKLGKLAKESYGSIRSGVTPPKTRAIQ